MAIATDRAYLPWCATTILSCALAAPSTGVTIHLILGEDVTDEDKARLLQMAKPDDLSIVFYPWHESDAEALPSKGRDLGGRLSWARILLPRILPDVERVIYLDADVLVVDGIDDLWNTTLDRNSVAAVSNVTNPSMNSHLASLGIPSRGDYFNAGVLLVDLARWREEGASKGMIELVEESGPFLWFDQDALNIYFSKRWKRMHPRWNAMNSLWVWPTWASDVFGDELLTEAKTNPAILHFEGPSIAKPWHSLCSHPWRGRYRSVLGLTPWADMSLEDQTLATRLISRLPEERWIHAYIRLDRLRRFLEEFRGRLTARSRES